jgi:hypothetical protein
LDITWLRREEAGKIVDGGDIDNRLKTLFDGLRMPHNGNEIASPPATDNERRYCLLEDDKLITKLSVSTHQLLEPMQPGEEPQDVDLLLHVAVEPTVSDLAFRAEATRTAQMAAAIAFGVYR